MVKNLPASVGDEGDVGSVPGLGRPPGNGNGSPLHCSSVAGYGPDGGRELDTAELHVPTHPPTHTQTHSGPAGTPLSVHL